MSKSLVLKVVSKDMKSYGGFQWPGVGGTVVAKDWDHTPECGGGLHGWLNGVGYFRCQQWSDDAEAKWLVLSVPTDSVVDLGGKVKFPWAEVVHVGDRKSASDVILSAGFVGPVIGATVTGGNRATVTGGYGATVTGGNYATVTGGDRATVTGGDHATVTGGDDAAVTGGDDATVTGGSRATVTGGNYATVTGGNYATVTGGYDATVTGGDHATVTGGNRATVTGGNYATLILFFYNGRRRCVTAHVGENGIKPNVPYRLNNKNEFEEVNDV